MPHIYKKNCNYCGIYYEHPGAKLFCSQKCHGGWRSKHPYKGGEVAKQCLICKKIFFVRPCRRDVAKYCSYGCLGVSQRKRVLRKCQTCSRDFEAYLYWANHGARFCSRTCYRPSQETKDKISKNSNVLRGSDSLNWKGGKPECKECGTKKKTYKGLYCKNCAKLGERSPMWRDGKTKFCKRIRICKKYKNWRIDVFENSKKRCETCKKKGIFGKELVVDHIVSLSSITNKYKVKTIKEAYKIPDFWNIKNGRILCVSCHDKTETSQRLFFKSIK